MKSTLLAVALIGMGMLVSAHAGIIFTDDFSTGPDAQWGNEVGNWQASGGTYNATVPGNFPNAHSSLPFSLADYSFNVDFTNIHDGGIWMRSSSSTGAIGRTGVLVVFKNEYVYFHDVLGENYGPVLGLAQHGLGDGGSGTITAEVFGNDYSVFINNSATPVATFTTSNHSLGQVALYDNGIQTFDNVTLSAVPEPSAYATIAFAVLGLTMAMNRRLGPNNKTTEL